MIKIKGWNRLFALAVLTVFALTAGCSKNPVSGGDSGPVPDAVQTVGPGGGVLETEDFSLSVPAGAFNSSVELRLYVDSFDDFSSHAATRAYEISGLPDVYVKSLRLALKHDSSLSAESYIALGRPVVDPLISDSVRVYKFQSAIDSSGYLVCHLPAPAAAGGRAAKSGRFSGFGTDGTDNTTSIRGVKNYKVSTPTQHFKIYYPDDMGAAVLLLKPLLEHYYDIITGDLGFSFNNRPWSWPIIVYIGEVHSSLHKRLHANGHYDPISTDPEENAQYGLPILDINEQSLRSAQYASIAQAAGPELLQFAIGLYAGPRKMVSNVDQRWLMSAVFNWSEEYFAESGAFKKPEFFPGFEMAPFHGMRAGAIADIVSSELHGRGMAPVIKYLADDARFGPKGAAAVYASISGGTDPVTSLITNVNGLVADWWPDFFHEYVLGNIYSVAASKFLDPNNISRTWDIEDAGDTLQEFTSTDVQGYAHLSAKLFLVNLDYANISSSANLRIDADGTVTDDAVAVIVFGVNNDDLYFLGEEKSGEATVIVENLRDYYDNGWRQFLIVVVNSMLSPPYTGKSDIDLTLKVETAAPPPDYNQIRVSVRFLRHYYREYSDGSSDYFDRDDALFAHSFYPGSFSGNTFTANYYYTDNPSYIVEGTITATLNSDHSAVTSVDWYEKYNLTGSDYEEIISFSGSDLDLDPTYYDGIAFTVKGSVTADHISGFTHTVTSSALDYSMQSFEGTTDSRIYVWIREL